MIQQLDPFTQQALAAMKAAVKSVVEDHRRRNRPLSSWENGRVVYRDPHTLRVVREESLSFGEAGETAGR